MSEMISRREAIKRIGLSTAAIAATGSLLEACSGNKSQATATANPVMEAPEGTKVTTKTWDSLGETVSMLGLGCMRLPKNGEGFNAPIDQQQVNDMVDYAIEHGLNYFDTAPAYGESETAMGIALSRHPRESYLIATKMSNFAFGPGAVATLEGAKEIFENSLKRLQVDYIDFLLLHSASDQAGMDSRFLNNGVLDYLISLKAEGKIHHLGFSYHGDNDFFFKMLDYYKWDFVQIQMNYVDWDMQTHHDEVLNSEGKTQYNALAERGIPAVVMEPVRGGALANVSDAIKSRLAGRFPTLSPAGCAVKFVGSFADVMVTLSGMSNLEQLKENIATFTDFVPFSEEEKNFLLETGVLYEENKHIPCTGCEYCMPCPNGVNIPGNFKVFNTTSDELNIPDKEKQSDKEYKKKKKILLTRYQKDLADGARADACTKCNACLPKCPQHIKIPDQLQMIKTLIESLG